MESKALPNPNLKPQLRPRKLNHPKRRAEQTLRHLWLPPIAETIITMLPLLKTLIVCPTSSSSQIWIISNNSCQKITSNSRWVVPIKMHMDLRLISNSNSRCTNLKWTIGWILITSNNNSSKINNSQWAALITSTISSNKWAITSNSLKIMVARMHSSLNNNKTLPSSNKIWWEAPIPVCTISKINKDINSPTICINNSKANFLCNRTTNTKITTLMEWWALNNNNSSNSSSSIISSLTRINTWCRIMGSNILKIYNRIIMNHIWTNSNNSNSKQMDIRAIQIINNSRCISLMPMKRSIMVPLTTIVAMHPVNKTLNPMLGHQPRRNNNNMIAWKREE